MANVAINNITDTWNSSGTTFTGIKFNVTDTASATASLLMDLQVGGASRFKVDKAGRFYLLNGASIGSSGSNLKLHFDSGDTYAFFSATGFIVRSDQALGWGSSAYPGGGWDVTLFRDAANTLAQRNGVNAQTNRLYGTYTDASNYRRLTKTMSAAGVAEIKPEGGGTGATGNVLHISGLPTANPGPGILWNNAGVVNVGT